MIKTLLTYLIVFIAVLLTANYLHQYILDINALQLRFNLRPLYLFFASFSILICVVFRVLLTVEKTKDQLGFIYLSTLVIKIFFFVLLFKTSILDLPDLSKKESFNLLIPIFVFLLVEVYFIAKILNYTKR